MSGRFNVRLNVTFTDYVNNVNEDFPNLSVDLGKREDPVAMIGDMLNTILQTMKQNSKNPESFPSEDIFALLRGPNPKMGITLFRGKQKVLVKPNDLTCTPWVSQIRDSDCSNFQVRQDTRSIFFDPTTSMTFAMIAPSPEFPIWLLIVIAAAVLILVLVIVRSRSRQPLLPSSKKRKN